MDEHTSQQSSNVYQHKPIQLDIEHKTNIGKPRWLGMSITVYISIQTQMARYTIKYASS